MPPGEVFLGVTAILSLFVLLPSIIGFTVVRSRRNKGGREMRQSELQAVIGAAVDEATEPLRRRVEALEAIATATDEEPASRIDPAVLADVLAPLPDEADDVAATARRARG